MSQKRNRYDLEYKRKIVQEYLSGTRTAQQIAEAEDLERGQIYKWKVQLENRARLERIDTIQDESHCSYEQARRIRDLEEELEAYQKKLAQLTLENDLLKKLHPNLAHTRKSSGYLEIKNALVRSKGRAK